MWKVGGRECLGICWRGEGEGSKGDLNAITDTAAGRYHCSETHSGHTFRYLYVYLGVPIQVDSGIHKKELPSVAQRAVPTRVKGRFELFISLCQSRHCVLINMIPEKAFLRSDLHEVCVFWGY